MKTNPKLSVSDIENKSPQEIADSTAMPCIFCDHQATRRQRIHGASLPHNPAGYSSTHLLEVIEFLDQNDFDTAVFLAESPGGAMQGCMIRFTALGGHRPRITSAKLK